MRTTLLCIICIALYSCSPRQPISSLSTMDLSPTISYSEDKGESFHDAVIVSGVRNQREAIAAEYKYISDHHGQRGKDWFLVGQTIIHDQQKVVDVVEIQLANSVDRKLIYFDATNLLLSKSGN